MFQNRNIVKILIILVFLVTPLIVFSVPLLISTLLFDSPDKIIFISYTKRYIMYFLIFTIVTLALGIIYFVKSKIIKLLTTIFTFLSCVILIGVGTMNYLYLDEQYIELNPLLGPAVVYGWDQLEHVIHETSNETTNEKENYIFVFKDGDVVEFQLKNDLNSAIRTALTEKILELEVSFEEY